MIYPSLPVIPLGLVFDWYVFGVQSYLQTRPFGVWKPRDSKIRVGCFQQLTLILQLSWYPVSVLTQEAFIFFGFLGILTQMLNGTGVFTYIYQQNYPNVGKYTIHGAYGYGFLHEFGKYSTYLTALVYLAQHVYPLVN